MPNTRWVLERSDPASCPRHPAPAPDGAVAGAGPFIPTSLVVVVLFVVILAVILEVIFIGILVVILVVIIVGILVVILIGILVATHLVVVVILVVIVLHKIV